MRKYLVEFIGTFFLVLTVGMTLINPETGPMAALAAPLAIGSAMMIMVYAGNHVSGGHYNPAITVAAWLRGRLPLAEVAPYIGSQLAASVVAAVVTLALKNDPGIRADELKIAPALIGEFLGTFAICYVMLNVATAKGTAGNSHYGLAIGFTVMTATLALGSLSCGGAFNPAVAIGLAVLHKAGAANLWIYLFSDFGAAVFAAVAYQYINPEDK